MLEDAFIQLLTNLHRSLDRVCEDLDRDRPDLSKALRAQAAWIPRPDEIAHGLGPPGLVELRPQLHEALTASLSDGSRFDAVMIERARPEQALQEGRS